MLLVHYLRERLGKTGTVVGCDTSNCGACTVHLDGRSVKSCNVLAVQADGARGHHDRGARRRRRAAPDAGGVPRVPRPPVRLLHAGDDHAGRRPAQRQPEARARRRSGTASRATSAGAPATTTSSGPCRRAAGIEVSRRPGSRGARHDRHRGRDRRRDRRARRRKEDQRLITGRTRWTDNIQLPGMLHLAMVRSPFAHAKHHQHRHLGRQGGAQRRRRAHRRGRRRRRRAR